MKFFLSRVFFLKGRVEGSWSIFKLTVGMGRQLKIKLVRFMIAFMEEEYSFGSEVVNSYDLGCLYSISVYLSEG